jgi:hypothetical protein
MAQPIVAVNAYRPRVKKRGTARKKEIAEWMADRTLLTEGQARAALSDVAEAALFYLLNRQDVEIEGLGRLIMDIDLNGQLTLGLRMETDFIEELNARFDKGAETLMNAEHVGKSSAELYDLWDEEHPDDPVERG